MLWLTSPVTTELTHLRGRFSRVMSDFLLTESELRTRRGGKWRRYPVDVLPAFVAEMDFKVAPAVQSAL